MIDKYTRPFFDDIFVNDGACNVCASEIFRGVHAFIHTFCGCRGVQSDVILRLRQRQRRFLNIRFLCKTPFDPSTFFYRQLFPSWGKVYVPIDFPILGLFD